MYQADWVGNRRWRPLDGIVNMEDGYIVDEVIVLPWHVDTRSKLVQTSHSGSENLTSNMATATGKYQRFAYI